MTDFDCIFRFTKPQSFADCVGDELPYGWEEQYDPEIGIYYINHHSSKYQRDKVLTTDEGRFQNKLRALRFC